MAKIKVKCQEGHEFYMEDYERRACPRCGKVVVGPKTDSGGPCFITTACVETAKLPDNCTELETMRHLRDDYLAKSDEGKRTIQEYYEIAPKIVEGIRGEENSKEVFGEIFRNIEKTVSLIEGGDLGGAAAHYKGMVLGLKRKYEKNPCSKNQQKR